MRREGWAWPNGDTIYPTHPFDRQPLPFNDVRPVPAVLITADELREIEEERDAAREECRRLTREGNSKICAAMRGGKPRLLASRITDDVRRAREGGGVLMDTGLVEIAAIVRAECPEASAIQWIKETRLRGEIEIGRTIGLKEARDAVIAAGNTERVRKHCNRLAALQAENERLKKEIARNAHLVDAVLMDLCSCSGGGPDDPHTCNVCHVYHRLHPSAGVAAMAAEREEE